MQRKYFIYLLYVITLQLFVWPSATNAEGEANKRLDVVSSFSIITDMAKQVGGDLINITTLVGPDSDAHVYEPKPEDVIAISKADLVLVNGLNFEGFLPRLVKSSRTKAHIAELTDGINLLSNHEHDKSHAERSHSHEHHEHHHHHGKYDPHAWQSVQNAKIYVSNIARALCAVDSADCGTFKSNAKDYTNKLNNLDKEIKNIISTIPMDQRAIVTSHDAFGYFERDYGIQFIGVEGISTEAEASAADVAVIVSKVKQNNVTAVFFENMTNPGLVKQISSETGVAIGGTLYSDALSDDDGPASTYVDMMRINIKTINQALNG